MAGALRQAARIVTGGALLAWLLLAAANAGAASEAIRLELANPALQPGLATNAGTLQAFYARRDYAPAWRSSSGESTPQALALRQAIADSSVHGLDPEYYHLAAITDLWLASNPLDIARLDILLTDALAQYATHLAQGRTTPAQVDPEWHVPVTQLDVAPLLDSAPGSPDLAAALERLAPPHAGYRRLQAALAHYRQLAAGGEWPTVPPGPTLHPGDRDPRLMALRKRLRAEGHFAGPSVAEPDLYDDALEAAVRRFQQLHTLTDDGLVGRRTLAALNVPVAARVAQVRLNLERWRWLPHELPRRHVVVNAAAFELKAYEGAEAQLTMRVIIGRPLRSTPAFSGALTGITVNPYWHTPESIARKDIVPAQIRDPDYLRSRNIRVFESWSPDAAELDPDQIDWVTLRGKRFPYHLRQEPGPKNALGRIKFLSSNDFSIYLHDTPDRQLFQREVRTFSSGCIRVQTAEDLALWLFAGVVGWNLDYLHALIDSGETQDFRLTQPVPLYLVYLTAWVDEVDGELHFADDVYARDAELATRLDAATASGDCGQPSHKVN